MVIVGSSAAPCAVGSVSSHGIVGAGGLVPFDKAWELCGEFWCQSSRDGNGFTCVFAAWFVIANVSDGLIVSFGNFFVVGAMVL